MLLVLYGQDGTPELDCISAAVIGEDESVVLAGYSSGNWNGTVMGGADCTAVKLDADGKELWRWQVSNRQHSSRFEIYNYQCFGLESTYEW